MPFGCQTEIASQIVNQKADYCLAVKGSQPTLHQGLVDFFQDHLDDDVARTTVRRHATSERGHGRDEQRYYFLCPVPETLPNRSRWTGLKAIGMAISNTERDGQECVEVRYYILSRYVSAQWFADPDVAGPAADQRVVRGSGQSVGERLRGEFPLEAGGRVPEPGDVRERGFGPVAHGRLER